MQIWIKSDLPVLLSLVLLQHAVTEADNLSTVHTGVHRKYQFALRAIKTQPPTCIPGEFDRFLSTST